MHRCRTVLVALTLITLTACGAQSSSTGATVAALGAAATSSAAPTTSAATTSAAPTTSAAATTSAASTTTAAATESAAPSAIAVTSAGPAATSPSVTRTPQATTVALPGSGSGRPHFATPEAAMRYLAAAWNANDLTSLKHVTQGTARLLLLGMHNEAVNLRLDHCDLRAGGNGDYLCHFVHSYPASFPTKLRQGSHGTSEFIAAPSASVGWYMFAYEGCG